METRFLHLKLIFLDGPGYPGTFPGYSWIDSGTFIFFIRNGKFPGNSQGQAKTAPQKTGPVPKFRFNIILIHAISNFQIGHQFDPENHHQTSPKWLIWCPFDRDCRLPEGAPKADSGGECFAPYEKKQYDSIREASPQAREKFSENR